MEDQKEIKQIKTKIKEIEHDFDIRIDTIETNVNNLTGMVTDLKSINNGIKAEMDTVSALSFQHNNMLFDTQKTISTLQASLENKILDVNKETNQQILLMNKSMNFNSTFIRWVCGTLTTVLTGVVITAITYVAVKFIPLLFA